VVVLGEAATSGQNLSITERLSTNPSHALSVAEIADYAFALNGRPASREQRLSATRAAHRLVRRIKKTDDRAKKLFGEAGREAEAAMGFRIEIWRWNTKFSSVSTRAGIPIEPVTEYSTSPRFGFLEDFKESQ
jgi:hypothetical protein